MVSRSTVVFGAVGDGARWDPKDWGPRRRSGDEQQSLTEPAHCTELGSGPAKGRANACGE